MFEPVRFKMMCQVAAGCAPPRGFVTLRDNTTGTRVLLRVRGAHPAQPVLLLFLGLLLFVASDARAHNVSDQDAAFVLQNAGSNVLPFMYLGAKHMLTGYDHLLFLFGVIFFLFRVRDVALYVTLFAVGHSLTLLLGVVGQWQFDAHVIDALIGLSVVYKAFENLDGFQTVFGVQPNFRLAVWIFGLIHGMGLASRIQQLKLPEEGLMPNLLAFNLGVEIGQLCALSLMLLAMARWRSRSTFLQSAVNANTALMVAGFVLMEYQLAAWIIKTQS